MKIIHPITKNKLSIQSKKGTQLIRKYINFYKKNKQVGGLGGLCLRGRHSCINYVISSHGCAIKRPRCCIHLERFMKFFFYSRLGNSLSCKGSMQTSICNPTRTLRSPRITEICHNDLKRSPIPKKMTKCSCQKFTINDYLLSPDDETHPDGFKSGVVDCSNRKILFNITGTLRLSSLLPKIMNYHVLNYGKELNMQVHCLFCRGFCSPGDVSAHPSMPLTEHHLPEGLEHGSGHLTQEQEQGKFSEFHFETEEASTPALASVPAPASVPVSASVPASAPAAVDPYDILEQQLKKLKIRRDDSLVQQFQDLGITEPGFKRPEW